MNNKITVIIPTYERRRYIARSLAFWSIYPVDLLIVDGSGSPSVEPKVYEAYENCKYFHLPISPEKRVHFAATRVVTPYAIIISDDEFLSYAALQDAVDVLETEPEVAAVLGETLAFKIYAGDLVWRRIYHTACELNITAKSPQARMTQRFQYTDNSIFNPLIRSDILRLAGQYLSDHQYTCPYVAEYQMEALLCSAGSVRVLPRLMWFRSLEGNMVTTKQHDREKLFHSWAKDSKNQKEVDRLVKSSSEFLGMAASTPPAVTGLEFVEMIVREEQRSFASPEGDTTDSFARRLYSKLPVVMRECIRNIYYLLNRRTPEGFMPIVSALKELNALGIGFDLQEISRIEKLISEGLRFHIRTP